MIDIIRILLKDTLRVFDRQINLGMGKNSTYDQEDIFKILLWASINYTSAESSVFELKNVNKRDKIPSADIVFHHIERQSYSKLQTQLERVVNSSFQMAMKRRLFGKYAAVAIDVHDIPYYGKVNNSLVMGCKHKKGTSYCYKYATIDIIEKNQRFTLKAIPLTQLSNDNAVTVNKLLEYAMKYVHVKYVLLDRGFYSKEVLRILERLQLKYIMPAVKSDRIKQIVKDNSNKASYFLKYIMGTKKNNIAFNLMVKYNEKDKEYHIFSTNFEIKYKNDIERIAEMYRKRWGIETGYRVKNDFLAITTTECCTVRMLYFMISVILYNFWLLCNLIYCCEHGIVLGTSKITTRVLKIYLEKYIVLAIETVKIAKKSDANSRCYLFVIKKAVFKCENCILDKKYRTQN